MKTTTFSAATFALLAIVGAQPHRQHRHLAKHLKRDVVTLVETVYLQPTPAPQVIVYVDQNGNPVSTTTENPVTMQTSVVPAAAVETPATVDSNPSVEEATSVSANAVYNSADEGSSGSSSSGSGSGITYSPYNTDGSCKSSDKVSSDIGNLGGAYSFVRTYGVDCDTVQNVLAAAKANSMKLFAGIFDLSNLDGDVSGLINNIGSDWDHIHTIAIGNELVQGGQDVSTVMAAVSSARTKLRAAGYNGPVVTVDTLAAAENHPEICNESDYCAVNSHPFFDPNTSADQAGTFLTTQMSQLKSVLSNSEQNIVIVETGWPSQGESNGNAVPSSENQATAIAAIKSAFSGQESNLVLFSPYNMHWKTSNSEQFNAEPWWGFMGDCPSG